MLFVVLGAPLGRLFEMLLPLAACAIAASFLLSVYLYARSFWAPAHALALGGDTGESLGSSALNAAQFLLIRWASVGLFFFFLLLLFFFSFDGGFWFSFG